MVGVWRPSKADVPPLRRPFTAICGALNRLAACRAPQAALASVFAVSPSLEIDCIPFTYLYVDAGVLPVLLLLLLLAGVVWESSSAQQPVAPRQSSAADPTPASLPAYLQCVKSYHFVTMRGGMRSYGGGMPWLALHVVPQATFLLPAPSAVPSPLHRLHAPSNHVSGRVACIQHYGGRKGGGRF